MPIKDDRIEVVLADCGVSAGPDQRLLWELATRLSPARYRLAVWLFAGAGMDGFAAALADREIPVRRLGDPAGFLGAGGFRLWLDLRRTRPALLHLNAPFGRGRRAAGVLSGAGDASRVVFSQRHLDAAAGSTRAAERRLVGRADAIVTSRVEVADRLVRELGASRDLVRVLPEGIDPPAVEREAAGARVIRESVGAGPLRPLVLCPERLEAGGVEPTLLDALERLSARGVGCIVGSLAEGAERAEFERLAAARGLDRQVRFLGPLGDPGKALAAADLVVLPASAVPADLLLESLVRARPVIAAAGPESAEHIEDGLTGRLVPAGDAVALAEALESLIRHADAARRLGAAAARRVRETHAWQGVVDSIEAVYDEVLGLATFAPAEESLSRAER